MDSIWVAEDFIMEQNAMVEGLFVEVDVEANLANELKHVPFEYGNILMDTFDVMDQEDTVAYFINFDTKEDWSEIESKIVETLGLEVEVVRSWQEAPVA